MPTVWASHNSPRTGNWVDHAYSSGWSATIGFATLDGLCASMDERGFAGGVTQVGIVAHGDSPGVVHLDRELTATSIASFTSGLDAGSLSHAAGKGHLLQLYCGQGCAGQRAAHGALHAVAGPTVYRLRGLRLDFEPAQQSRSDSRGRVRLPWAQPPRPQSRGDDDAVG
jgi:hypothetical protein